MLTFRKSRAHSSHWRLEEYVNDRTASQVSITGSTQAEIEQQLRTWGLPAEGGKGELVNRLWSALQRLAQQKTGQVSPLTIHHQERCC